MVGPGYENFFSDVKKYFKEIIDKYNFSIEESSPNRIRLLSSKCIITVVIADYYQLETWVTNPTSPTKFYSTGIIMKIKNHHPTQISKSDEKSFNDSRKYEEYMGIRIKRGATIFLQCLQYILEGDFSWTGDYEKYHSEISELIRNVRNLSPQDPIHKKFLHDDPTWINDMQKRIKQSGG